MEGGRKGGRKGGERREGGREEGHGLRKTMERENMRGINKE